MEQTPSNNNIGQLLSGMLADVETEVPGHLNDGENLLLGVYLGLAKFSSLGELLADIESFLREEIDLEKVTRENVSEINFSALATRFGDRYGLTKLNALTNENLDELEDLGWKATRTILLKVLRPQLQKIPFAEAQQLVMVLEEFISSYTIIQGANTEDVLDNMKFWDVFKEYRFTLELDSSDSKKMKELPPSDEHIVWVGTNYSTEDAAEDLQTQYKLIADKEQWIKFFENHKEPIEVVPGQLNKLIAVLWHMENRGLIEKSKKKGCWKIWQLILVDHDKKPFPKELRKTSSRINAGKTQKDKKDYEYGKRVVAEMMKQDCDNSATIRDNGKTDNSI